MVCTMENPSVSQVSCVIEQQTQVAKKQTILNVTWEGYDEIVNRLARVIRDSDWEFDHIVCIARGGMLAGLLLSHHFDKLLGVIAANSYEGENEMQQGRLSISIRIAMTASKLAKRILLVDDLVDTGTTLREVKRSIEENYPEVEEVRTAVLWTKTCSTFTPNYAVDNVDANTWIYQPFEKPLII